MTKPHTFKLLTLAGLLAASGAALGNTLYLKMPTDAGTSMFRQGAADAGGVAQS